MPDRGIRPAKRVLARALAATGLSAGLLRAQQIVHRAGYVRVVNYHDTPESAAASLEAQIRFYAGHFSPVAADDLDCFFRNGKWSARKPGLIISFDDGLRSNYEIAVPLLERYGFTGWFFVPVGFIDTPVERQADFARAHKILIHEQRPERLAMSWDELRTLSARHVVGSHTRTHRRMYSSVPLHDLEDEIVGSRADLAERLNQAVNAFCWVGGEENTYSAAAANAVRRAGYRYAFMTNNAPIVSGTDALHIQRTNIEASWPLEMVQFQLSGVMDVLYSRKRARVNRLTA